MTNKSFNCPDCDRLLTAVGGKAPRHRNFSTSAWCDFSGGDAARVIAKTEREWALRRAKEAVSAADRNLAIARHRLDDAATIAAVALDVATSARAKLVSLEEESEPKHREEAAE